MHRCIFMTGSYRVFVSMVIVLVAAGTMYRLPAQATIPSGTVISVLYLSKTAGGPEHDWMARGLSDMLATDLAQNRNLVLVERERLAKILEEQELAGTGLFDPAQAPQTAKLLGASGLVYGSYAVLGNTLRVDVRLVDTRSSKVLGTASARGPLDTTLDLEFELARGLLENLGFGNKSQAPAQAHTASALGTRNLGAAKSYYTGLGLLDRGDFAGAEGQFRASLNQDPLFSRPAEGLEAAYRFLKDFRRQRWQREINTLLADIHSLEARIGAPRFFSFADALINPGAFGFADAAAVSTAFQKAPRVFSGDTPAQALWNLQTLLYELAGKAVEYFEDHTLESACQKRMISIADQAEKEFPKDPWLAELVYQKLLAIRFGGDWQAIKNLCEHIMTTWPDYRMIQSVEDAYQAALEQLQ